MVSTYNINIGLFDSVSYKNKFVKLGQICAFLDVFLYQKVLSRARALKQLTNET